MQHAPKCDTMYELTHLGYQTQLAKINQLHTSIPTTLLLLGLSALEGKGSDDEMNHRHFSAVENGILLIITVDILALLVCPDTRLQALCCLSVFHHLRLERLETFPSSFKQSRLPGSTCLPPHSTIQAYRIGYHCLENAPVSASWNPLALHHRRPLPTVLPFLIGAINPRDEF